MRDHPCHQHRPGHNTDICLTGPCGYCGSCASGNIDGLDPDSSIPPKDMELHRLCVFELSLSCGHLVTIAISGWYPVSVACCDRLGGTIWHGEYVPYYSHVDYVNVLSERYEYRPKGAPRDPDRLIDRRPRTDEPYQSPCPGGGASAGRYPARVGATWNIDGSVPPDATH